MKKVLLPFLLFSSLFVSSCSKSENSILTQDGTAILLTRAEVQSYTFDADDTPSAESLFEAGDMITVVGAAEEDVVFILSDDGEWLSLSQFSWMESPQDVYAYFGTNTSISDGDQMPDLLVAHIECNGQIPTDGVLSFAGDRAFCHATALVEVKISGWNEYVNPTVSLKNMHSVVSLSNVGNYIIDTKYLYSINLDLTSNHDGVLTYQGRVPAGDATNSNINANYSLLVNSLNAFEYILDDSLIPSYFEAGKIFSFTLAYDYAMLQTN